MQNFDHDIGSWEKRQFFRRKLAKIAENCDHNIDPRWVCGKMLRTSLLSINTQLIPCVKSGPKFFNTFVIIKILPEVNNNPFGKNSSNLVTCSSLNVTY
jgi:hypothetical protein